jgi:UDP-galactose transporter B1
MKESFSYLWLLICVIGIMSSLSVYGITLEYATSQGRNLDEFSFVLVTTIVYAFVAYVAREVVDEKPPPVIPIFELLALSAASTCSGITSIHSLHYVIYPVQVIFKACKPVPVMIFGSLWFGRRYSLSKWFNIVLITIGVSLFLGINDISNVNTSHKTNGNNMLWGIATLLLSLMCDGVTGALEDKLMSRNDIGPFSLMFYVQLGKAVLSLIGLLLTNGFDEFAQLFGESYAVILVLGTSGAIGQVSQQISQSLYIVHHNTVIDTASIVHLCITLLL